jgi:integrase
MCAQIVALLAPAAIAAAMRAGTACELNDADEPGLCLRIGKRVATWSWRGRDAHGRVRRFGLGRYPHVGLAEARRRGRALADEVRRGADPIAEARARRTVRQAPRGHTLKDLFVLYGRHVGAGIKSWPDMERHARYVFRAHLDTPLAALTLAALQLSVDAHPKPKSAAHATRCFRPLLRWAAAPGRGYIDRSLLDLKASAPRPVRDRVLGREELRALLPALRERANDDIYAAAHRLILLTLVRRGEVEKARWRDVDFVAHTWTLPQTKNGQVHTIPLSQQAATLLRGVMPTNSAPDPDGFVFTTPNGTPISRWEEATKRLWTASGTSGWTRHDLRRTAATLLGELGTIPEIIEAGLNHAAIRSRIAAVYNRWRYLPQVAAALQQLADLLDSIEQGGATVVALHSGRGHKGC